MPITVYFLKDSISKIINDETMNNSSVNVGELLSIKDRINSLIDRLCDDAEGNDADDNEDDTENNEEDKSGEAE